MHWLVPKEKKYFEMLSEQSQNALEGAKELKIFLEDYGNLERGERKARVFAIKKIETKGDDMCRKVLETLNQKTRAPIDKQDIREMAILLDDVTDLIHSVASKFVILSIERVEKHITKMVNLDFSAVNEVNKCVIGLSSLKSIDGHYENIRGLEREADSIYSESLSDLFHFYRNSIDIIKYKEVYDLLEDITDKCKDVADLMRGIVDKHSS